MITAHDTKENFVSNMDCLLWRKNSYNKSVSITFLLETHLGGLHYDLGSQHTNYNLTKALL